MVLHSQEKVHASKQTLKNDGNKNAKPYKILLNIRYNNITTAVKYQCIMLD